MDGDSFRFYDPESRRFLPNLLESENMRENAAERAQIQEERATAEAARAETEARARAEADAEIVRLRAEIERIKRTNGGSS